MKVGLQVSSFTWPGGDAAIGPTLARIARQADEVGFDSLWVMDHLFQIRSVGAPEEPMLEGLTTLGYLAAHTSRIRLGLMVGGIHYRHPGVWLKAVTTLDVLSGGRAWFGIGAAWNEEESRGLGIPMPVLADRFELLEDTLRLVRDGWAGPHGTERAFQGHATNATRILNSPQALSRPRPPILVGGGGELRTLRLVARYADACNVFGTPEQVAHKYAVLRGHCETEGRDYASIERTNLTWVSVTPDGRTGSMTPAGLVDRLGGWAEAGSHHTIFSVRNVWDPAKLELLGRDVLPAVRALGEPSPLDPPRPLGGPSLDTP
ncbi:MAG: LLM class F420-dependent oxidoreductase [Chloroflexota bacterium]